jgi:hypothetical protein
MRGDWRRWGRGLAGLVTLCACNAVPEFATFDIAGRVLDPSSAPVSRAQVDVRVQDYHCSWTMDSARINTGDDGEYRAPALLGFRFNNCIEVRVSPSVGTGLATGAAKRSEVDAPVRASDAIRVDVHLARLLSP